MSFQNLYYIAYGYQMCFGTRH